MNIPGRHLLLLGAALALLGADAGILVAARRNRSAPVGGTVELTERELRLAPSLAESTAIELELRWAGHGPGQRAAHAPDWLDAGKLGELGFDCRVASTAPTARRHYRAQDPAWVWLVLEHRSPLPPSTPPRSTLVPLDAGRDAARLRSKFPDLTRYLLVRAVIRASLAGYDPERDVAIHPPRIQGVIQDVLPNRIGVPSEFAPLLQPLRKPREEDDSPRDPARFAARVSWGTRGEPWIETVRLLPEQAAP